MQRLVVVIAVGLAALGACVVTLLSARADDSRRAQLAVAQVHTAFADLQTAPNRAIVLQARPGSDAGPRALVQAFADQTATSLSRLAQAMRQLRSFPRISELPALERAVDRNIAAHQTAVGVVR